MGTKNLFVGLDIGTTKIVALIGSLNEYGKLKIIGIGKSKSLGVHRGVVNNITQTIQSIQAAVNEACLLYTSPSPRDRTRSRMPSSA